MYTTHHPSNPTRDQHDQSASRTALSDAQINQLCAQYKEKPPPELGPNADAAAFAEAASLLRTLGKARARGNATFIRQLLPRLTLEERERLAYETQMYGAFYLGEEVQRFNEVQKVSVLHFCNVYNSAQAVAPPSCGHRISTLHLVVLCSTELLEASRCRV